ncbi:GNAT family N-acetyltransferase [Georgenia faecalis]|uniref:GNAT family N-acetyltransferase n=1 Tax=Georgenia faecalis TaxID=2483799 RepID=A0ABV9DCZ4_9MICO|nr:GNAT family protein [Georgenia faecalis]
MTAPVRGRLANAVVELRPLEPTDASALFAALDHDEVWAYGYGGREARPRDVTGMEQYMARRLTGGTGGGVAWAVVRCEDGRLVGTSTLGDIDLPNEAAHLGWTAYDPAVWGTTINPATKLAILTHAFEGCGLGRVKFLVDDRNLRSQAAVARLGAVREGVLRRHRPRRDGTWRNSVVFSVIVDEWPAVRAGLERRLGRTGTPRP